MQKKKKNCKMTYIVEKTKAVTFSCPHKQIRKSFRTVLRFSTLFSSFLLFYNPSLPSAVISGLVGKSWVIKKRLEGNRIHHKHSTKHTQKHKLFLMRHTENIRPMYGLDHWIHIIELYWRVQIAPRVTQGICLKFFFLYQNKNTAIC